MHLEADSGRSGIGEGFSWNQTPGRIWIDGDKRKTPLGDVHFYQLGQRWKAKQFFFCQYYNIFQKKEKKERKEEQQQLSPLQTLPHLQKQLVFFEITRHHSLTR